MTNPNAACAGVYFYPPTNYSACAAGALPVLLPPLAQ